MAPAGYPQNDPVGFFVDAEHGTIDVGGHNLRASRTFQSVQAHPNVSLVVDDSANTSAPDPVLGRDPARSYGSGRTVR